MQRWGTEVHRLFYFWAAPWSSVAAPFRSCCFGETRHPCWKDLWGLPCDGYNCLHWFHLCSTIQIRNIAQNYFKLIALELGWRCVPVIAARQKRSATISKWKGPLNLTSDEHDCHKALLLSKPCSMRTNRKTSAVTRTLLVCHAMCTSQHWSGGVLRIFVFVRYMWQFANFVYSVQK